MVKVTKANKQKAYKMNSISLAKHHKENCKESDCNVSLLLLAQMAIDAGVSFTDKELELFL